MADLNCAIETFDEALKGLHVDDPFDRGTLLCNLQFCLDLRFIRAGSMEDLHSAIDLGYDTLRKTLRDEGLTDAAVARGLHRATRALGDVSVTKTSRQRRGGDCGEGQLTCGADEGGSDTWEEETDVTLLIPLRTQQRSRLWTTFRSIICTIAV